MPRAALELRIAVTLDPARRADRWRLAQLLNSLGGMEQALAELRVLAADPDSGPYRAMARAAIPQVEQARQAAATAASGGNVPLP